MLILNEDQLLYTKYKHLSDKQQTKGDVIYMVKYWKTEEGTSAAVSFARTKT